MNAQQTNFDIKQARIIQILQKPHSSEKATNVAEKHKQFVFKVAPDATKDEVKQAVELMFEVKVEKVNISNVKSKARRFKQIAGQRKGWKKAYVALKEGQDINFVGTK